MTPRSDGKHAYPEYGEHIAMAPPPPPPSRCQGCLSFIRQLFGFLFSHIGLLSLVVGYCIMGAFIFEELEKDNEIFVKRNMTRTREAVTEQLWDITREMEVLRQDNWTAEVTNQLRRFEKTLIIAMKEKGWDGKEDEGSITWTFGGALFYSITVITTIGYGHIAPKTAVAKIVTIFYAILGIPLTVLCWSNIGDAMANAFRFTYWRIFCYVCTRKPKKKRKRTLSQRRGLSVHTPPTPQSTHHQHGGAPPMRSRSIRRSQRTSTRSNDTVRSADSSQISYSIPDQERFYEENNGPQVKQRPHDLDLDLITQPSTTTTTHQQQQHQQQQQGDQSASTQQSEKKSSSAAARMARGLGIKRGGDRGSQKSEKSNHSAGSDSPSSNMGMLQSTAAAAGRGVRQISGNLRLDRVPEDDWMHDEGPAATETYYYEDYGGGGISDDEMDDYSRKSVPIWLSLCLVIAYIVWGAFIFQNWEGWSLLDSSYFCFITLTTIGFGDLVPNQQSQDGESRLALCSLYLLFGIAMIAMSFNLVQEQVINNVKTLGRQLGILKDEDEEDDY